MAEIVVRRLTGDDAAAYQAVRLRSLDEHPEAFASSVEDERGRSIRQLRQRLDGSTDEGHTLGAFVEGAVVGLLYFGRRDHLKTRHKAHLGAMYTLPEQRGKGVARALLTHTIAHARTLDGLEELVLAVTVGNGVARNLYLSVGFEPYAIEPRYLKIGDRYYNMEWMILRL